MPHYYFVPCNVLPYKRYVLTVLLKLAVWQKYPAT